MNLPDFSSLRGVQCSERHIQLHYPEFYYHLQTLYRDPDISFQEKMYWQVHGLSSRPVCPVCGKEITAFEGFHKGYRQYCSRKCMNQDPAKKAAIRRTCQEKYGGPAPASSPSVKRKIRSTWDTRYGDPQIQEQRLNQFRETMNRRYGGVGSASPQLREKRRLTCLERYGVENTSQHPAIREKIVRAFHASLSTPRNFDKLKISKLAQSQRRYPDIIDFTTLPEEPGTTYWLCRCPHLSSPCPRPCEERTYITPKSVHRDRYTRNTELCTKLLPIQDPSSSSGYERMVASWLDQWGIEYVSHDRSLLSGQELDLYIPSRKIAIEVHGCYWHSDRFKSPNYHINKYLRCREQEIRLIQVWEDWMIRKPEIVQSFLQAKLGACHQVIQARKCVIKEIDYKTSQQFLEENHIQGKCSSNYRLGTFYENRLVAVMCFNRRSGMSGGKGTGKDEAELIRFCNLRDHRVVGAAGKMMKYYIKKFHPSVMVSYSANDISDGNLYRTLGFTEADKISKAYWYIEPGSFQRYHRSLFTRSRIAHRWWPGEYDPDDHSWTERSVLDEKGYIRIYDSGTTRWTLEVPLQTTRWILKPGEHGE